MGQLTRIRDKETGLCLWCSMTEAQKKIDAGTHEIIRRTATRMGAVLR